MIPAISIRSMMRPNLWLLAITFCIFSSKLTATGSIPPSLQGVPIPPTHGLLDGEDPVIINKLIAIQLGKALFWDMNVGEDGVACATCHFHAGADGRYINQLSPGIPHRNAKKGTTYFPTASGGMGSVNYELRVSDFPFYQLDSVADRDSPVLFESDDVVSSAGVFRARFTGSNPDGDGCDSVFDPIFHLGSLNTRQIQTRQAPSVINAAFNYRNFWDGRANNIFNGTSLYGPRDPDAGVLVMDTNGTVTKQPLRLENSSLASQAVAPLRNSIEMSCKNRTLPDIGRKLLHRRALENQEVDSDDSVLGRLRDPSGKGLHKTYRSLIKASFAPKYWQGQGDFGHPRGRGSRPYSHMEANFSLFFGLALQLYQQTLISDQTPFDTPRLSQDSQIPKGLNKQQRAGLQVFLHSQCALCHRGPTLSSAAHPDVYTEPDTFATLRLVNRKTINGSFTGQGVAQGIIDEGYFNTSVARTKNDISLGGDDPFGNPYSFTGQYVQKLWQGNDLVDPVLVYSCELDNPFFMDFKNGELQEDLAITDKCGIRSVYAKVPTPEVMDNELKKGIKGRIMTAVRGAFKVPTLRNVELTGPYMHNGSLLTLEQVVEFYFRGGNFSNQYHFATLVFPQQVSVTDRANLVEFLKSLTDERVRWERAPFDHPQLLVPHGQMETPDPDNPAHAQDRFLMVPAVGKNGRSAALGPIKPFHEYLSP